MTWACTNGTRADGPTLDHDGLELISRGASSQRIKSARTGSRRSSAGFQLLVGKARFNLFHHPRQRHGERGQGSVQIRGGHSVSAYAVACQAIAGGWLASGVDNAA